MTWNGGHRLRVVLASAGVLAVTATSSLAYLADPAADPDAWRLNYSALEARVTKPANLTPLLGDIRGLGGHVGVIVPPVSYPGVATYLGWWPSGSLQSLLGQRGVAAIHAPRSAGVSVAAHASGAIHFWHAAVTGTLPARAATTGAEAWQPALEPRTRGGDARDPGDRPAAGHSLRDGPGGPVTNGTSDQMTGTVTTALFLVESNGGLDPNTYTWTPADSATEVNGVLAAMSWWSSSALTYGQSVTFTLLTYGASSATCQTQYEPVLHASSEVSLWVNDILGHLGYTNGSDVTRARNFDQSLISTYHSNWAYSIFAGYNPSPAPEQYTDGYSAWAYFGGPYLQTLYRSYSYTVQRVTAHESGHIFGACDEYNPACSCEVCSKNVLNANCETCNPATVTCVMKDNVLVLCTYTPGQIGWQPAVANVQIASATVSDPPPGNASGDADPGESVTLAVTLQNSGNAAARGVSGTLSAIDPAITIQSGAAYFGDVLLTAAGTSSFALTVSSTATAGSTARLQLALTGSGGFTQLDTLVLPITPLRALRVTPATVNNGGVAMLGIGGHGMLAGLSLTVERAADVTYTATTVTRVSADSASALIDLTGATYGTWDVVLHNSSGATSRLTAGVLIQTVGPQILSVSPAIASAADSFGFGVGGHNFTQPVAVWLEQGLTKRYTAGLQQISADSLFTGLSLRGLAPGTYDVVEQNFDAQTARLVSGFVVYPVPDLQTVSPDLWPTGQTFTATFTGASFAVGATAWLSAKNRAPVVASSLTVDSDSSAHAVFNLSSAGTGSRTVVLQNPGGGRDSVTLAVELVTPPTVFVTRPRAGDRLHPGATAIASWTAQSLGNGLDRILVLLSLDGGITFGSVVATAGATDTTALWLVPLVQSDSAVVRVEAFDVDNFSGTDDSDGLFALDSLTSAPALGAASEKALPHRLGVTLLDSRVGEGLRARLELPRTCAVRAALFDMRGSRIAVWDDGQALRLAGRHLMTWRLAPPRPAAGVYVLRVDAAGESVIRRVVWMR